MAALDDLLRAIATMQGTKIEGEIPGSIAKLATTGATIDARDTLERLRHRQAMEKVAQKDALKVAELGRQAQAIKIQQADAQRIFSNALGQLSPHTPVAAAAITALKKNYGDTGRILAARLEQTLAAKTERVAVNILSRHTREWARLGVGDRLTDEIKTEVKRRLQSGESIESYLDAQKRNAVADVAAARAGRKAESLRRVVGEGQEGLISEFERAAGKGRTGTQRFLARKAIKGGRAQMAAESAARRARGLRWGGLGAAGLALILLPKLFGAKKDQGIPPELQMMMMQRLQGTGAGAPDERLTAGRDLINLNRALSIVKMLQEMGAAQQQAVPEAARIV